MHYVAADLAGRERSELATGGHALVEPLQLRAFQQRREAGPADEHHMQQPRVATGRGDDSDLVDHADR